MTIRYDPTPAIGYSQGRIVDAKVRPFQSPTGNYYFVIDDMAYDVHPFRSDLGGWPVRYSQRILDC